MTAQDITRLTAQHGHSNKQDASLGCDQANLPVTATMALKTSSHHFPIPQSFQSS